MKVIVYIFLLALSPFFASAESYSVFTENGKVGLKNQAGQVMIPAKYQSIGWSNRTFSTVDGVTGYELEGHWGLISTSNKVITKPLYLTLIPGDGTFLIASHTGKGIRPQTGCINGNGKVVIPFEYDGLTLSSLRAIVFMIRDRQYQFGLVDLENKMIIPIQYQAIHPIGSLRFAVENKERKVAIFTEAGKQVTGFELDSVNAFARNYTIFYQNRKQGVIDRDGIIKVKPEYKNIEITNDGTVRGQKPNTWCFLDDKNQVLQQVECDSIEGAAKDVYVLQYGGTAKLVDKSFKPINDVSCQAIGKFKDGIAQFQRNYHYGLLRDNGTVLIDAEYDSLLLSGRSILSCRTVQHKKAWILLDSLGNARHSKTYDAITPYSQHLFAVRKNNFWGAINENGKEIIACVHDSIKAASDTSVLVKFHGQYGIINLHEDWLVTPQPHQLQLINSLYYLEFTAPNTFLKTVRGEVVYFTTNTLVPHEDFLLEELPSGGSWRINYKGVVMSNQRGDIGLVEQIFEEHEGLRAIKKDGKYGFIDNRGRLRIANRYDNVKPFSQQLAGVKILGKWGFLSHDDKIAVQPVYEDVTNFNYGISIVKLKGMYGCINNTGKVVLPVRYQSISTLKNHRMIIRLEDLVGLADWTGKILLTPKYITLQDLDNGFVIVMKNQKYSLLNLEGISKIPMIYDYLEYDRINNRYLALKRADWSTLAF